MKSSRLKGLYAITDPLLMGDQLIDKAQQAISAGINILQYRNKLASIEQQEQESLQLVHICKKHNVLLIINDNVELAQKVKADGVHLGQSDCLIQFARKILGEKKIIGVTCHNKIKLAQSAQAHGADYIAFGRFFDSQTKPTAPHAELSILAAAHKTISIPIVAIGGITLDSASLLLNQGADMLAIIHAIFGQKNITNATRQFIEIIDSPREPV